MQDRYAGDIGDYVKMAFLREHSHRVPSGRPAWPGQGAERGGNEDWGAIRNTCSPPATWRHYCARTFDKPKGVVAAWRSAACLSGTAAAERSGFTIKRPSTRAGAATEGGARHVEGGSTALHGR